MASLPHLCPYEKKWQFLGSCTEIFTARLPNKMTKGFNFRGSIFHFNIQPISIRAPARTSFAELLDPTLGNLVKLTLQQCFPTKIPRSSHSQNLLLTSCTTFCLAKVASRAPEPNRLCRVIPSSLRIHIRMYDALVYPSKSWFNRFSKLGCAEIAGIVSDITSF